MWYKDSEEKKVKISSEKNLNCHQNLDYDIQLNNSSLIQTDKQCKELLFIHVLLKNPKTAYH